MKKLIIRRIFIFAAMALSTSIGTATVAGHQWLASTSPAIAAMVDPWTATTLAYGLVIGALMWGIAKWQGIPIAELQTLLAEKGLYAGRIDGIAGDKTRVALARAIDDPEITSDEVLADKPKFKRPQGSKAL